MFTEAEIGALIDNPKIQDAVQSIKKEFKKDEAPFLEISDHDFFCLILMMPSVAIALAKGSVSLMEEVALQKKARTVSKGGHFLKKDPVVYALKFLIKNPGKWEKPFYEIIRLAMEQSFDLSIITDDSPYLESISDSEFHRLLFNAPYIFIRFMNAFFWDESQELLIEKRPISQVEYDKVISIGKNLGLNKTLIFKKFLDNFIVN